MSDELAIEARGLGKSYGDVRVLSDVDVAVPRGTVHALLGPNGAGKTTMVRILATLLRPDAGTARVAGYDVICEQALVRRSISLTSQDAAIDEMQTGEENLRMMARLNRLPAKTAGDRARELLDQFDLIDAGGRYVKTYSGGMRRRLDIAAGLIVRPAVLFLDEPTTGLDPRSRQAVWDVVADLTAAGVTILLTTQYLEEADRLADRIAVIDGGRVVAEGTATELKQQVGGHRLDLTMADGAAFHQVGTLLGSRATRQNTDALTISVATDGSAAQVRALLDEIDPARRAVDRFTVHTASLDDVFFALTGHPAETTEQKETARV